MRKSISSSPESQSKRLTIGQIRDAIHTVRVRSTGKNWSVKKVADSKVWRYATKDKALARALDLAGESKWAVVVHDKNGRITRMTSPKRATAKA